MKDMTAGELARELLEFFGPNGTRWIQRKLVSPEGMCFHGAVSDILLGQPQYVIKALASVAEPFAGKVREQYPGQVYASQPMWLMIDFNDSHTWDELRAILEKVAADETQ
jgi:hypothetical protein